MFAWLIRCFSTDFYRNEQLLVRPPSMCATCRHLFLLTLLLSPIAAFLGSYKRLPQLALMDMPRSLHSMENILPDGLEMLFNVTRTDGTLSLKHAPESRLESRNGTLIHVHKGNNSFICWDRGLPWCVWSATREPIRLPIASLDDVTLYMNADVPPETQMCFESKVWS